MEICRVERMTKAPLHFAASSQTEARTAGLYIGQAETCLIIYRLGNLSTGGRVVSAPAW